MFLTFSEFVLDYYPQNRNDEANDSNDVKREGDSGSPLIGPVNATSEPPERSGRFTPVTGYNEIWSRKLFPDHKLGWYRGV